jgi:hypothetical protein
MRNDDNSDFEDLTRLNQPKWLDAAVSKYFDDSVQIPTPSATPFENGDLQQRGITAASAAYTLSRLREATGGLLPEADGLADLLVRAANETNSDIVAIQRWLGATGPGIYDINDSISDPAAFTRLALALRIPLSAALRFRRSQQPVHQSVAATSQPQGRLQNEDLDTSAGGPSNDDVEAYIRACYRELDQAE